MPIVTAQEKLPGKEMFCAQVPTERRVTECTPGTPESRTIRMLTMLGDTWGTPDDFSDCDEQTRARRRQVYGGGLAI